LTSWETIRFSRRTLFHRVGFSNTFNYFKIRCLKIGDICRRFL